MLYCRVSVDNHKIFFAFFFPRKYKGSGLPLDRYHNVHLMEDLKCEIPRKSINIESSGTNKTIKTVSPGNVKHGPRVGVNSEAIKLSCKTQYFHELVVYKLCLLN